MCEKHLCVHQEATTEMITGTQPLRDAGPCRSWWGPWACGELLCAKSKPNLVHTHSYLHIQKLLEELTET